ncbi:MAG TPA: glycosyltransferase family 39 protein, partial [Bacteroidaceae bacterium]|nr:glycosyltransferase family 39 protein [Bacteroidaceae bacterium]
MENLIFGILIIIICIAGYYLAFRQFRRQRILVSIILLMICGLILRFYAASDLYLHQWDERYHALVAKNMIEQPFKPVLYADPVLSYDYKNWSANHIWVHKQPFPLWTMALSMSVFGTNEIALRLPSIILTTLGIWVTFAIGWSLFNKRVGFIAAFLYSVHGLIIELTAGRVATDHIDVFFLFFIQLAVWLAIKFARDKKPLFNVLCGTSIGIAILSKWLPALIVLPIWLL